MNIVILGDGLLGSELHHQTNWDIFSRKKNGIDITQLASWKNLLSPYDVIINCIAYTNTYSQDREACLKINFGGVADLLDYCVIENKKLVHISTDYVYANSVHPASETDVPVHQATHYAYSKLLADGYIELRGKRYLIVRCSHKPSPFPYPQAWDDVHGNFDYVPVIASYIIQLIKKDATGIFNIGTPSKTMYDLAKQTQQHVLPSKKTNPLVPHNLEMQLDKVEGFFKKTSAST